MAASVYCFAPNTAVWKESRVLKIMFGWGLGTLCMSLMFQAVSLLILRYLVDYVGLAAGLAGLLIGLGKVYDAVTDPLMGAISDRTDSRFGRRRPYLLLGSIVSALSFVLLFNLAQFADWAPSLLLGMVVIALLLNATGYTIFNVPYLAMPAEMGLGFHERTRLMSFRAAAVAIGGVSATAGGPFLIGAFGGGVGGYGSMAWVLGGVILLAGLACTAMMRWAPSDVPPKPSQFSLTSQFQTAWQNKPFMLLLGVKVGHLVGLAIYLASMPFFFGVILQVPLTYLGSYFLVQSSFILLSQLFWVKFTARVGKNRAYYLAAAFYILALFSWQLAEAGASFFEIALRAVFTGTGAGGVLLIGQSLLPDTMQYDYQRTGLRREGVFAGVYTTIEKLSFAVGPAVLGLLLGWAGYVGGADAIQTETSREVITAGVSILPGLGITLAALIMTRYRLDAHQLESSSPEAK